MIEPGLHELNELLPNCLREDRLRIEAVLRRTAGPAGREFRRISVGMVEKLLHQARRSVGIRHRRHERLPQLNYPAALPILQRKDEIIAAIKKNPAVIIAGETGSGKTTQLPKFCLEAGYGIEGKIACTQPRRVAALSISRRIAQELNVTWGREVGCKIRFADQSSPETYIKLMTDGILLAETQGDRDLNEYEVVIVDEAHERSLNIDFLLGHLQGLLRKRPELKVIISSATIDTQAFSKAFFDAPVIEVSGRMYPVEVRYAPFDHEAEERGDITYVEAAVNAVEQIALESESGDVLVFMPSERDIRETQADLQGRFGNYAEIIPLFGRLSAGEQERVFAPNSRRKIVVATNIAETSLTIPGIRYVVDTGLARMSRYSPRTRTKRLPIEPISQASANQRAGRCGRVANGICVRLYAEAEYAERPQFTQPEIQRANLAEVILRMKAWHLGEIEQFPFVNPPQPQAIAKGYELLFELGALDADRNLTPMGKDLARLPVDPSIGRMVLQSVREGALEDVLVIAAGLSIQDPRERPMDQPDAADQAHRRFKDPDSDFLSLIKIWEAFHDRWEECKTQNQLRKFCKANFISYIRMREWVDIHAQLRDALGEVTRFWESSTPPPPQHAPRRAPGGRELPTRYIAIHRSILSGLLGHIARRQERNIYQATGSRQVMVFPGSGLFDSESKPARKKAPGGEPAPKKPSQPEWVVAGEIVETSRLFGRTLARVLPEWIIELGEHLCKRSYSEPGWNREGGRVLVRERVLLLGLELRDGRVDFGRINPQEATEIFIRSALMEEDMDAPPRFVHHNRQLRQKLEVWRTRSRGEKLPDLDEALFNFYAQRLQAVSSVHDLNRVIREHHTEPNFLQAAETDLTGGIAVCWDSAGFPSQIQLANQKVELEYAYAPGESHDGITVKVPAAMMPLVEAGMLDWVVPGMREEQVEFLLRELPKSLRVPLMPLQARAKEMAAELRASDGLDTLRALIRRKYGVDIPADAWKRDALPDYLRVRVAVTGNNQKVVAAGRDVTAIKQQLENHTTPDEVKAWGEATQKWERYALEGWTFEDLPERIQISNANGVPVYAYPGIEWDGQVVNLKLYRKLELADAATRAGFAQLMELALAKDLAWLRKDLRALDRVKDVYLTLGPPEELQSTAYENLRRYLARPPAAVLPLRREAFESAVAEARTRIPGLVPSFAETVSTILKLRQEILVHRQPYPSMRTDLDGLVPKGFLAHIPHERLSHLPRYIKAILVRAQRAAMNPAKDQEKARLIQPYREALHSAARHPLSPAARAAWHELRWMLEEYRVSVFAQELGTAYPISPKRLDGAMDALRKALAGGDGSGAR